MYSQLWRIVQLLVILVVCYVALRVVRKCFKVSERVRYAVYVNMLVPSVHNIRVHYILYRLSIMNSPIDLFTDNTIIYININ